MENILHQKVETMAKLVKRKQCSAAELVEAHLERIRAINPVINAAVEVLEQSAREAAQTADADLAAGRECGPLHGVPFSVKDAINVARTRCTAGTLGFKDAPCAAEDAMLVKRLRAAGGIPIAKTNLPDLLFSFETDNFVFGRTNNPYDVSRTPGGSSGGESALIAAGGSPLGLGSDCAGSVRLPAAFCGIASIKPTSGRLPRTGHVPPAGGWIEKLWQMGPMARWTADLVLALHVLAGEDGVDITSPPVPLLRAEPLKTLRVAFFTNNGVARCTPPVAQAVEQCARALEGICAQVEEARPRGMEQSYELEMAILGADGADGIDAYLRGIGSTRVHPLLTAFVDRMRPHRATASQFARTWAQWDAYKAGLLRFLEDYDVILSPVYPSTALPHGGSFEQSRFEGFSYTMAWNVAGFPAATVRCAEQDGLPINVQVIAKPWRELTALAVCQLIEDAFGGWRPPNVK